MGRTTTKHEHVDQDEANTSTNIDVKVKETSEGNESKKANEAEKTAEPVAESKKADTKEETTKDEPEKTDQKQNPKDKPTTKVDSDEKTQKEPATKDVTVKVKPKEKAIVLAPLEETEASITKSTGKSEEDKETKKAEETKEEANAHETKTKATDVKPAATKPTATKSKATKKAEPSKTQITEGDKTTKSTKDQDLKLPLFRRIHIKIGYIIAGVIVILLAIFFGRVALWEHDYLARMEGSERHVTATGNLAIGDDGEEVDTTEPTEAEIREYIVAADKPRYFSIPSLGIYNARILELGVKDNGELATPWNIYDMGWYTGSALPGELGVSMFDGHGGDIGYGILKTLPRIAIGAIIKVEMGDGRVFNYRVVDTAVKAIGDEANEYMATAFSTPNGSRSSLSIITCTGDYWQYSQTYSHRFFLRAVLED